MDKKINLTNRHIILISIAVLLLAIISIYAFFGTQLYHQAGLAFADQDWQEAHNLYARYNHSYRYSNVFRIKDLDNNLAKTQLILEVQEFEKNADYESLIPGYDSISANFHDVYNSLNIGPKKYNAYLQWGDECLQAGDFDKAEEIYLKFNEIYQSDDNFSSDEIINQIMPQLYSDWAADLRKNKEYIQSIEKYNIISTDYKKYSNEEQITSEIQATNLELLDALLNNKEYELAYEQAKYIRETWPKSFVSDNLNERYFLASSQYAASLHNKEDFQTEINILEETIKNLPGVVDMEDISTQLTLAYINYADTCFEKGDYYDAIDYYEKYLASAQDEQNNADILTKVLTAQEAILNDDGEDGQKMINRISQAICTGDISIPDIVNSIPKDAAKINICKAESETEGETENNNQISPDYIANTPADIKYIVKFTNGIKDIEKCVYNSSRVLTLQQYYVEISVFDKQTGQRIMWDQIFGSEPNECGKTYTFSSNKATRIGSEVEPSQIDTWISENLMSN